MKIWKPIDGFDGYEVSSDGEVRCWNSQNGKGEKLTEPRLLKPSKFADKPYMRVTLSKMASGASVAFITWFLKRSLALVLMAWKRVTAQPAHRTIASRTCVGIRTRQTCSTRNFTARAFAVKRFPDRESRKSRRSKSRLRLRLKQATAR